VCVTLCEELNDDDDDDDDPWVPWEFPTFAHLYFTPLSSWAKQESVGESPVLSRGIPNGTKLYLEF